MYLITLQSQIQLTPITPISISNINHFLSYIYAITQFSIPINSITYLINVAKYYSGEIKCYSLGSKALQVSFHFKFLGLKIMDMTAYFNI